MCYLCVWQWLALCLDVPAWGTGHPNEHILITLFLLTASARLSLGTNLALGVGSAAALIFCFGILGRNVGLLIAMIMENFLDSLLQWHSDV
jgi:hypothetical protein